MSIATEIEDNLKAETNAINGYRALLSRREFINGSDRRSIKHILKEEQEHRRRLMKILRRYK